MSIFKDRSVVFRPGRGLQVVKEGYEEIMRQTRVILGKADREEDAWNQGPKELGVLTFWRRTRFGVNLVAGEKGVFEE